MAGDHSSLPRTSATAAPDDSRNAPSSEPVAETFSIAPETVLPSRGPAIERAVGLPADDACPDDALAEKTRFSLMGLLACCTLLAVVLAIGRNLPLSLFAGLTGIAVIISQVAISVLRVRWPLAHLAWWLLLVVYLVASACAVAARSH